MKRQTSITHGLCRLTSDSIRPYFLLQSILGFGCGKWIRTERLSLSNMLVVGSLIILPFGLMLTGAILGFYTDVYSSDYYRYSIGLYCGGYFFILLVWIVSFIDSPTIQKILLTIPFIAAIHRALKINTKSKEHPPLVFLTDGGHVENLGLYPLLRDKKNDTIVVVDGSEDPEDKCTDLMNVLDLARDKLELSFFSVSGGDMKTAFYKFKNSTDNILTENDSTNKNSTENVFHFRFREKDQNREGDIWYIKARQDDLLAKRAPGICCACCHGTKCPSCFNCCCGTFPHHSTAFQFFTSQHFEEYSKLGNDSGKKVRDEIMKK